jgi:hypothetical protein
MKRYELTDQRWRLVKPLLPTRTVITGCQPRDPWAPCGVCTEGHSSKIYRSGLGYGRRSMATIGIGATRARLTKSLKPCRFAWAVKARPIWVCGALTAPRFRSVARLPEGQEGLIQYRQEPEDQALGRSQSEFSSKMHWVSDGWSLALAVEVLPGQHRESTQLKVVMKDMGFLNSSTDRASGLGGLPTIEY